MTEVEIKLRGKLRIDTRPANEQHGKPYKQLVLVTVTGQAYFLMVAVIGAENALAYDEKVHDMIKVGAEVLVEGVVREDVRQVYVSVLLPAAA